MALMLAICIVLRFPISTLVNIIVYRDVLCFSLLIVAITLEPAAKIILGRGDIVVSEIFFGSVDRHIDVFY
jgi:hypothetical protein